MEENHGFFRSVIKGALTACVLMLVFVLVFALVVKITTISSSVIKVVNQFIKLLAIFTACSFFVKGERGLIKGAGVGLISGALIHLLFALFGGGTGFNFPLVLDLIFTTLIGGISGILSVNFKR